MGALPAYSSYAAPAREAQPSIPVPSVRAVRGGAASSPYEGRDTSASPLRVIIIAVVVLAFITVVCCARVSLSAAAVVTSMETTKLESSVQAARSAGADLEVSQSSLSNPTRIGTQAKDLGMGAPLEVGVIVMEQDVVATDSTGALSLSQSVANAVEVGA